MPPRPLALLLALLAACSRSPDRAPGRDAAPPATAAAARPGASAAVAARPGAPAAAATAAPAAGGKRVLGVSALAAWDALPADQKATIRTYSTLFLHQSVGQDLEDGAADLGFRFEYYGPRQATLAPGLNGGIFTDVSGLSNGEPRAKLAAFRAEVERHAGKVRVAVLKLGYADVTGELLEAVKGSYLSTMGALKGRGVRVVHVTPPLVFDAADNAPRMALRTWMLATFPDDVTLDLQDIESLDARGQRCAQGGVWQICPDWRSRPGCASKGQGVDGPGQGHLCATAGASFARALLMAVYTAGR